jgi:hypothetical protein
LRKGQTQPENENQLLLKTILEWKLESLMVKKRRQTILRLTYNVRERHLQVMIQSFACKHTEKLYNGERVPRFQSIMQQAERQLQILDSATCIEDLLKYNEICLDFA